MNDYNLELSGGSESVPVTETPSETIIPAESTTTGEESLSDAPIAEAKTEELLDLPDGRKVTAAEAMKEWKENFMPDYTKKAQRLAELEKANAVTIPAKEETDPWRDPNYVPQTYAEIIEAAKLEAVKEIERKTQNEQRAMQDAKQYVDTQLTEIRKIDPTLDENTLFSHANKYGFKDLKVAHANMVDMKKAILDTEQRTLKNIKTREAAPVAGTTTTKAPETPGIDISTVGKFSSAAEYLASLQNK